MKISRFKPQFLALALGLMGSSLAVQAEEHRPATQTGSSADQIAHLEKVALQLGLKIEDLTPEVIVEPFFCDGFEQPEPEIPDACYYGGMILASSTN